MIQFVGIQAWHWQYIPPEARPRLCEDTKGIVALREGEVLAVCILDSWTTNGCQIHIWIANPIVLKHGFAEEVFKYVFLTAERNVVIGATPSDNAKALKFIKHIGFVEQARLADAHEPGVDLVITTMRREDCRWIPAPEPRLRAVEV